MGNRAHLAPADKLKREIQAVLTEELAQDSHRSGFGKFDGFAYIGTEASNRSVCQTAHMRLHISLEDDLVAELDRRVGKRRRSAFIARVLRRTLDDESRWDEILASVGTIEDEGHEWDPDPAAWVHAQRRGDERRVG